MRLLTLAAAATVPDPHQFKLNTEFGVRDPSTPSPEGAGATRRRGPLSHGGGGAGHASLLRLLALVALGLAAAIVLAKLLVRRARYLTRDPRRLAAVRGHTARHRETQPCGRRVPAPDPAGEVDVREPQGDLPRPEPRRAEAELRVALHAAAALGPHVDMRPKSGERTRQPDCPAHGSRQRQTWEARPQAGRRDSADR